MVPIKRDIGNLVGVLKCFGEVKGLSANFHKRSIVAIRCAHLNLGYILQNLLPDDIWPPAFGMATKESDF